MASFAEPGSFTGGQETIAEWTGRGDSFRSLSNPHGELVEPSTSSELVKEIEPYEERHRKSLTPLPLRATGLTYLLSVFFLAPTRVGERDAKS
jgi:hypothetical protein